MKRLSENRADHQRVARVIEPLCEDASMVAAGGGGAWRINAIGQGSEGRAFMVQRRDGNLIAGETAVVVKLYDGEDALESASRQQTIMRLLYEQVDGRHEHGWLLRAPEPLRLSQDPPALVIGWVPGSPLGSTLQQKSMRDPVEICSLAQAILRGLEAYWSRHGQLYGDLSMHNMLCDPDQRTLAFIDCGVDETDDWGASLDLKAWHPASRDLGYQLLNGAASLKQYAYRPLAWRRRMRFSEELLRRFGARFATQAQREQFLIEVRQGCGVHLQQIHTPGANAKTGPRGWWRWLVSRTATFWVDRVIGRCAQAKPSAREERVSVSSKKPWRISRLDHHSTWMGGGS